MPNITNTTVCYGPIGPTVVLPVQTGGTMITSGFSLCNGSTMTGLWYVNNTIVQLQNCTTTVATTSWIFYPQQPLAAVGSNVPGVLFTPPRPRPRVVPAVIRAGRRAARRSIDLYARFRGMDEVRRFIRGEEITFSGALYDYRIRKTLNVLTQTMNPGSTHIPYSLRVADKLTGKVLAAGCVVFPALPVIDQILALSFHIQDPDDERILLNTTNWTPRLVMTSLPSRNILQAA